MILVCTGTQKFPFDRLLAETDRLISAGVITEEVTAQTGYSSYVPVLYASAPFFDQKDMEDLIQRADLVISHGGSGTIMNALRFRKKVIAVPRLAAFGEHINDHQLQLVQALSEQRYIAACTDITQLGETIRMARQTGFRIYSGDPSAIVNDLRRFLL